MSKQVQKVADWKKSHSHLFTTSTKSSTIAPKRDLTRYVRWPLYIRIQRQRAILKKRIKVPAPINQFNRVLTKDQAATLFQLLGKYRPETKQAKHDRLKARAAAEVEGKKVEDSGKPNFVKYGLNHVTSLIESKKAKLVVIAHDVDPIELVVWLPTLCRKMNVPFVIVKGKSRLGYLVHKKQTAVLAITDVVKGDEPKLQQIVDNAMLAFNNSVERKTGGLILSERTIQDMEKKKLKGVNTIRK